MNRTDTLPDTSTLAPRLYHGGYDATPEYAVMSWRNEFAAIDGAAQRRFWAYRDGYRRALATCRADRRAAIQVLNAANTAYDQVRYTEHDSAAFLRVINAARAFNAIHNRQREALAARRDLAAPCHRAPVTHYTTEAYAERIQWPAHVRASYVARWTHAALDPAAMRTYAALHHYLGSKNERPAPRRGPDTYGHTRIVRRGADTIAVRFHDVDVLTFHDYDCAGAGPRVMLRNGGFWTDATYRRIRAYLPAGLALERFTVPAAARARGVDMPNSAAQLTTWQESTLDAAEDQERRATDGSVQSPFLLSALLSGAGFKREYVARSQERMQYALWTVVLRNGARVPFQDGMTICLAAPQAPQVPHCPRS